MSSIDSPTSLFFPLHVNRHLVEQKIGESEA
jgi:hypothetical protein